MKAAAHLLAMLVGLSGCASISDEAALQRENRELLAATTETFKLERAHEQWTYDILRLVKPTMKPGEKVSGIHFGLLDGTTVYVTKPWDWMHGGYSLRVEFDGAHWKIVERWQLAFDEKRPNQTPEPTPTSVTPRADARVAPAAVVAHL